MAKFNFKFQAILEIKEKLEEKAKNEYGVAIENLEAEKSKLEVLNNKKNDTINTLRELNKATLSVTELNDYNNFISGLKFKIISQGKTVKKFEKKAKEKQQALILAMADRKSFEKMKSNDYDVYLKEEKIKEQKEIDELISFKHSVK